MKNIGEVNRLVEVGHALADIKYAGYVTTGLDGGMPT